MTDFGIVFMPLTVLSFIFAVVGIIRIRHLEDRVEELEKLIP